MRIWLLVGVCAACGPGARTVEPDAGLELPAGVWEPVPGAGRGGAAVALGDDGTLWWAINETTVIHDLTRDITETRVWLTRTSSTGESLMTPVLVDPRVVDGGPAIAVRGNQVAVVGSSYSHTNATFVRVFDGDGEPIDAGAHDIALVPPDANLHGMPSLVIESTGAMRLLGAFDSSTTGEVTVVDLDRVGAPLATTYIGTADDGAPSRLAVAARPDDTLVVAWDRNYDQCSGPRPSQTLATAMGTQPGPLLSVGDLPERGELDPALASINDTQYVAWVADMYAAGSSIGLARYPDVGTTLARFGDETHQSRAPMLALAAPDRGAIAWVDYATPFAVQKMASFAQQGDTFVVSAPRDLASATGGLTYITSFLRVADERYLVAWIETSGMPENPVTHLYATMLDFAGDERHPSPRVVPPSDPQRAAPRPRTALGLVPCTH